MEKVVNAFVEASTDDCEKLQKLMVVLANEGLSTGLGYIIHNAVRTIAQKLRTPHQ